MTGPSPNPHQKHTGDRNKSTTKVQRRRPQVIDGLGSHCVTGIHGSGRPCEALRPAARCPGGFAMVAAVNEYVTQIGALPSTAR